MLDTKILTAWLEDELNRMSDDDNVKFDLTGDTGLADRFPNAFKLPVEGTVTQISGSYVPIKDLGAYSSTLECRLVVDKDRIEAVRQVLTRYITQNIAQTVLINGYSAFMNFQMPVFGELSVKTGIGLGSECQFFVTFEFGGAAIISNTVSLIINGEAVKPLQFIVTREMNVSSDTYSETAQIESLPQSHLVKISAAIPLTQGGIARELKKAILDGTIYNTVYQVGYKDNLDEEVYPAMIVYGDATITNQAGTYSSLAVAFTNKREEQTNG